LTEENTTLPHFNGQSGDRRFPDGVQALWGELHYEVANLHCRWIIYRQLYGTSPERIDVLNRADRTFFAVVQDVLLQDVQISLSNLGDPAESQSRNGPPRTNLTLKALEKQLNAEGESAVAGELNQLIKAFDNSCKKIRRRRNKWIAHFDRETMLNRRVVPLENSSRAEVECALSKLREAMNCVEDHYTGEKTSYDLTVMGTDGGALLDVLSKGLRYEELMRSGGVAHDVP